MIRKNKRTTSEIPRDSEILEAYLNKHAYNKADARRIKRQLRKLTFALR